jgi:5-methylcytosine-specific restriction endonuclease McrA
MALTNWEKKERRERYQQYILSPQWAHKRFEVFRRDGYMCQMCHRMPAAQVHHKTYKNFGNEPLEDLIAVCEQCHKDHHGIKDNRR